MKTRSQNKRGRGALESGGTDDAGEGAGATETRRRSQRPSARESRQTEDAVADDDNNDNDAAADDDNDDVGDLTTQEAIRRELEGNLKLQSVIASQFAYTSVRAGKRSGGDTYGSLEEYWEARLEARRNVVMCRAEVKGRRGYAKQGTKAGYGDKFAFYLGKNFSAKSEAVAKVMADAVKLAKIEAGEDDAFKDPLLPGEDLTAYDLNDPTKTLNDNIHILLSLFSEETWQWVGVQELSDNVRKSLRLHEFPTDRFSSKIHKEISYHHPDTYQKLDLLHLFPTDPLNGNS